MTDRFAIWEQITGVAGLATAACPRGVSAPAVREPARRGV